MESAELKNQLKRLESKLYVTYGIGLLVLFLLAVLSNSFLKEQAAKQATSLIKRMVERGDFRETIYTLNDAKLDYFDAVVYFDDHGSRLFSIPAQLDPEFINRHGVLPWLLYARQPIDLYFGEDGGHKTGSVLFIYGRYSHVPYAFLIWLAFTLATIPLVVSARVRVTENYKQYVALCEEASRADLARRVRHDIRSPLGALQIATQNLSEINPKQRAIIQQVTERIREIVSELELIRTPKGEAPISNGIASPNSILTIAQEIIQEKRMQLAYRKHIQINPDFSKDAFFLFVKVNAAEFKRTLSNIIDNAIEASGDRGRITVHIEADKNQAVIEVSDKGTGISPADLDQVRKRGFTRKAEGSGLGLYYAEQTVEAAGGSLAIDSTLGSGTKVTIRLPSCSPPPWYTQSIKVPHNGTVVILDDQESTHLSWRLRLDELKGLGRDFTVTSFRSAGDLIQWQETRPMPGRELLYLLDYDLGEGMTGLDVAKRLNLSTNAILVTGHFDSEEIQKRCADQRIGLVPKSHLAKIELQQFNDFSP